MKILEWLKRNPCKECDYYCDANGTCQSKKCASNNPYVTKIDRLFCESYKADKAPTIIEADKEEI